MAAEQPRAFPIAEAAVLLDLSADGIRKRIQRGTLAGYKTDDGGWMVHVPEELYARSGRPDADRPPQPHIAVGPEQLEQAIARTGERYLADMNVIFDKVAAVYDGRLADKDELIAELRERVARAEAAADGVRSAAAPTPPAPVTEAEGFWSRVRGVLRG